MFKNLINLEKNYLPHVNEYVEYDFRNLQALELLEDSFWELNYPSLFHDEYLNPAENSHGPVYFGKIDTIFNNSFRY
jgi:hypothetical protein